MGARPIYCQEAANPDIYHPYDTPLEFDVSFIGQAYGERPGYIRHLLDQGIDVRVWGYGWQGFVPGGAADAIPLTQRLGRAARKLFTAEGRQVLLKNFRKAAGMDPQVLLPAAAVGGPLDDQEMIRLFSRSKINLGFSACGETHVSGERIVQVRLRDFEVPMSGGFYMVEYLDELEEFFEIGKEIVCYHGPADLADKIRYYLTHEAEREAIRRAGHERCLRDHSWQKRLTDAFRTMGLVR
jgi:spore maturation protein CgeB